MIDKGAGTAVDEIGGVRDGMFRANHFAFTESQSKDAKCLWIEGLDEVLSIAGNRLKRELARALDTAKERKIAGARR